MKSILYTKYGSADVLQLKDIEIPTPKDDQVLIKVYAASVNPLDWHTMQAKPFLVRTSEGFFKPKSPLLGADVAGRVEKVGSAVTQFKAGDEVFGCGWGSFAEYVCMKESRLALKPANVSFEAAAATPVAAFTALQGLRDAGKIQPGQKVLVNGAAGGVGTFAVQIAKSYGAEVTGVCSTRNLEMVRSIGADHVVDYSMEDFTKSGQQYDLIFDAVANHSVSEYARALKPQGIFVMAGFSTMPHLFHIIVVGSWVSKRGTKKIGMMGTATPNQKDLLAIKELLEQGRIVSVIDRQYSLAEVPEAIRYLEKGHARGKVIISVVTAR